MLPTRRIFGPVVAADLARQAGLELEDARASAVLDGSLLDFAVVPPTGATDGVAVDCAGCGTRPRAGRRRQW